MARVVPEAGSDAKLQFAGLAWVALRAFGHPKIAAAPVDLLTTSCGHSSRRILVVSACVNRSLYY